MAHTILHAVCCEYFAKAASDYARINTIDGTKKFLEAMTGNIQTIQNTIHTYEETLAYCQKMQTQGIDLQVSFKDSDLRKALGLPDAQESQQQPPKPSNPPEQPKDKYTMPPDDKSWSEYKRKTLKANWRIYSKKKRETIWKGPDIYPESISDEGRISMRYWTWDEIEYLRARANETMTIAELTKKLPEHDGEDICKMLLSLNLTIAQTAPKSEPKPEPKPEPENPYDPERELPPSITNPPLHMRLRIIRLAAGLTPQQVQSKSGISKTTLQKLEDGATTPNILALTKLEKVYHAKADAITHAPISKFAPFLEDDSKQQRLKTVRIRLGFSIETFAKKLGIQPETLNKYETGSVPIPNNIYEIIWDEFQIPDHIAKNEFIQNSDNTINLPGNQEYQTTTAENLIKFRTMRRLSQTELANLAGCSVSHINSIEAQRTHPSDDMLVRLAKALDIPPHQLLGDRIIQPRAMFKAKNEIKAAQEQNASEESIANKIRTARETSGLTIKALSQKSGIPVEQIVTLEEEGLTGGNGYFYRKLCKYLSIEP